MNRLITTLTAGALAAGFAIAPASAQNLPPPGNVNPGSLNSGAEDTGAENQPRSFGPYYSTPLYGSPAPTYAPGFNTYAPQSGMTYGPFAPATGGETYGSGGAPAIGSDEE
ncbi:hypothetical protein [Pseudorhodoplanes sp.]|uniref:hypothetical protein n=1 Tax=Pseudorhodoplanes sp. TaxID=1934341 RepID=UPI002BCB2F25|nr:hypothetical protein [Pseudorhodoplanes sp.]HWV52723.1 hypothetical protein [Pseudorhodoplanes sp.]